MRKDIPEISRQFSLKLRDSCGFQELKNICHGNNNQKITDPCMSLLLSPENANDLMILAFKEVLHREPNFCSTKDAIIIGTSWQLARKNNFYIL